MSRMDELNALEEAEAEQASGQSMMLLMDRTAAKTKLLGGLAWVHRKRTEPELTYSEFMKSHRSIEILAYLYGTEDDDVEADEADDQAEEAGALEPFPGEGSEAAGNARGVADAEGAVLSGDGDQPD